VDINKPEFMGKSALEKIIANGGPDRLEVGLIGSEKKLTQKMQRQWEIIVDGVNVGKVRQLVYSRIRKQTIGIAFIKKEYATFGTKVIVRTTEGEEESYEVCKMPFVSSRD
jgi:glycine cleavage system aminomethyltransferase T